MGKHEQSHKDLPADQLKRKSYLYLYLTNMVQKEFYKNDGKLVPKHALEDNILGENLPWETVTAIHTSNNGPIFYRKSRQQELWVRIGA